jgi:glutathione S-transferase
MQKTALLTTHFPVYFSKFEEVKKENPGDYLVGKGLTWIDILMAQTLEFYQDTVDKDFIKAFPALSQLQKTVFEIPQIKKWLQERPPNDR